MSGFGYIPCHACGEYSAIKSVDYVQYSESDAPFRFHAYCPTCSKSFSRLACYAQQARPTPPFTKFRGYRTPYNVAYRNQI